MKKYSEDLKSALLALVTSKAASVRDAAARVGVSYSTATRWVHQSRIRALVPTKAAPKFAQLVRETESEIHVRVGRAEIVVRRGVDVELLQTVIEALTGEAP